MPCPTAFSTSSSSLTSVVSKCVIVPDQKSTLGDLKLTVSDLPMLSVHYIQKGVLFNLPPFPIETLLSLLKLGLSQALSHFPPLAGRLVTDSNGHVYIACNDAGAEFFHATASGNLFVSDVLAPGHTPDCVKGFYPFDFDRSVSYSAHFKPILAVQVTELADGVFVGCAVCHSVVDGTSFWNFFNSFAELCSGANKINKRPDFTRDSALISSSVLKLPEGGPEVTFDVNQPLLERVFSFSREAIQKLKATTNKKRSSDNGDINAVELMGKLSNDTYLKSWLSSNNNNNKNNQNDKKTGEISSFQSLCALLWRAVTRARKLPSQKTTTFKMAVNVRHRLEPKLDAYYFGNAIQSIVTHASAGDVSSRDPRWIAEQLSVNVKAHNDTMVRRFVGDWESNPKCFPLGNFDGATITMGSSPRFPMYDNDFGWGRPLAVRSGGANKFDGKISAFPGREGTGAVDLEVVLSPQTMLALESDSEFMQYLPNLKSESSEEESTVISIWVEKHTAEKDCLIYKKKIIEKINLPLNNLRPDPRSSFPSFVNGRRPSSAACRFSPVTVRLSLLGGSHLSLSSVRLGQSPSLCVFSSTHRWAVVFGWFQSLLDLAINPVRSLSDLIWVSRFFSLQSNLGLLGFFLSLI